MYTMYQEIDPDTYIVPSAVKPCSSHPHLVSVKLHLLEDPCLCKVHLTEITWGYLMFYFFFYVTWELVMVLAGNSYYTSIMLVGRFFLICFMCTESVTLIVSPM